MVGKLVYQCNTRIDIVFVVGVVSRFMNDPTRIHLEAIEHIIQYLKGTQDYGIFYEEGDANVV